MCNSLIGRKVEVMKEGEQDLENDCISFASGTIPLVLNYEGRFLGWGQEGGLRLPCAFIERKGGEVAVALANTLKFTEPLAPEITVALTHSLEAGP